MGRIKTTVISHLNDHFEKNKQPILKDKSIDNINNNDDTVNKILEVLDTKIRPAVAREVEISNLSRLKMVLLKLNFKGVTRLSKLFNDT